MTSSIRASTVALASAGAVFAGVIAYAIYFDHRRRTDVEFRKALKRDSRREARVAKDEAEAEGAQQKAAIKAAVRGACEEGFPTDVEEREAYFMNEISRGEGLSQDGSDQIEAALCFYRALKVYPQPRDLIGIYDKTVAKPIIDILAEMIASDPNIDVGSFGRRASSDSGSIGLGGIDN